MHPKALLFPLSLHNLATFLKVFLSQNDPMRRFRDGWATVMVFQGWQLSVWSWQIGPTNLPNIWQDQMSRFKVLNTCSLTLYCFSSAKTLAISNFSALIALKDPMICRTPKPPFPNRPTLVRWLRVTSALRASRKWGYLSQKKTFQGVSRISLRINRFRINSKKSHGC